MTSVVIMHGGTIGDTILVLPLFQWIRRAFPGRRIILFNFDDGRILKEILEPTGLCDAFYSYNTKRTSFIWRLREKARTWWFFRRARAKDLVCMLRTFRLPQADISGMEKGLMSSWRYVGVSRFWGMGWREIPLSEHRNVLSLFAEKLRKSGIYVPEDSELTWDYNFTELEKEHAKSEMEKFPFPVEDAVAIGCGGKKQVCQWPENFWIDLLTWLATEKKVKLIFLGGPNDGEKIERLRKNLPPDSSVSLTSLSIRETLLVLSHCRCYIGHDTGTIHMAASVGLRCFGIFSAHNLKKLWEPWAGRGVQHHVFRQDLECSPCKEHVCPKGSPAPCIARITPEMVKNELQRYEFSRDSTHTNAPPK